MEGEIHSDARHIRTCQHCHGRYDWRRSPSTSLKMTYCGSLCEAADLGFTIDALIHCERELPLEVPKVKELAAAAA